MAEHGDVGRELSRLSWRKSTFSNNGGNCVEIAPMGGGGVAVRDSKNPGGTALKFTRDEWNAFLSGAKAGKFDFG
jgi:hypothetical protein